MFKIIKKIFIVLSNNIVNGSNLKKCVPLTSQKCMTQFTLLFYIVMNTVKNFTNIDLQLI